jgi:trehalose 6-phosphate phosphatase
VTDSNWPPWPAFPALFLDLDGTLLELAEHPERAVPSARLRALLPALQPATGGAVAIISGRSISSLDRLLAPHRFAAAGVHGLERRKVNGDIVATAIDTAQLTRIHEDIQRFVAQHEGLLLEDKALSLALHYRQRPELEAEVNRFIGDLGDALPPELEFQPGKKVFELKHREVDKGRAILSFMAEAPFAGRRPVFVGDDITDEAGFVAVNKLDGISVKVNSTQTKAQWHLESVELVLSWLEQAIAGSMVPAEHDGQG